VRIIAAASRSLVDDTSPVSGSVRSLRAVPGCDSRREPAFSVVEPGTAPAFSWGMERPVDRTARTGVAPS
jgi:hypothetical protein